MLPFCPINMVIEYNYIGEIMDDNEIEITNYQIILSIVSIGTIIVSIILLLNNKYKEEYKQGFLNGNEEYNIALYNRIVLFFIFLAFLIINYQIYIKIKEKNEEDPTPYLLQVYASLLAFVSTIITLYVVLISRKEEAANVENPEI